MQRRTRTRHQRKPYSTTRRVHRRRGFSKRYNRAKHTRYKKRRRRKTRRGRQRRGGGLFGVGARIDNKDWVCQINAENPNDFNRFSILSGPRDMAKDKSSFKFFDTPHNCNIFHYKGKNGEKYMYRNPGAVGENGTLKCSKLSATTKTPKLCPKPKEPEQQQQQQEVMTPEARAAWLLQEAQDRADRKALGEGGG